VQTPSPTQAEIGLKILWRNPRQAEIVNHHARSDLQQRIGKSWLEKTGAQRKGKKKKKKEERERNHEKKKKKPLKRAS
jgi:hypothetical protein